MKLFKIVMLGINESDNIIVEQHLTYEDARAKILHYQTNDWVHYFEIKEEVK